MIGIYKITNIKGAIYIGQSRNIKKRFNAYRNKVEKNKGQPKLYNSLLKYGHETHIFEVIQECKLEELNIYERYWQEYYNACDRPNLNCTLTSIDETPSVVSEETRKRQSDAAKIRMARLMKNPEYLATMKEVYKKQIGRKMPPMKESQKEAIRQANFRNKNFVGENNPWFGVDRSGEKNVMWGKNHSKETKEKIRIKATNRNHNEKTKLLMSIQRSMGGNVKAKIVLNTETGIFYDCCKSAWLSQTKYAYTTLKGKVNGSVKNNTSFKFV